MSAENRVYNTILVGLGRIGWTTHLPALITHPGFQISAVVDPMEDRLSECHQKFGIPGFNTLSEALKQGTFDLAVIASPTCFHAKQTIEALNAGCHVFCDKPAALNLDEFLQMKTIAKECQRILTIYQPARIDRHTLYLKELVHSGKLGKVFLVKLLRERFSCRNDWQALRKYGGGMLLNYGSHMVDQSNFIFNNAGKVLSCTADRILSSGDADDVVKLLLRYGTVTVDIDINQVAADSMFRYAVYGSKGSAILPAKGDAWKISLQKDSDKLAAKLHADLSAPERKYPASEEEFHYEMVTPTETTPPIKQYYENLYQAIKDGVKLLNPLSETENLIKMIDRAGEIAKENNNL